MDFQGIAQAVSTIAVMCVNFYSTAMQSGVSEEEAQMLTQMFMNAVFSKARGEE